MLCCSSSLVGSPGGSMESNLLHALNRKRIKIENRMNDTVFMPFIAIKIKKVGHLINNGIKIYLFF
ncbi:hypothetical protein MASR1M31_09230 [Porphyromonadaceae bacterium]